MKKNKEKFEVVFEDEDVIIVNKPAGLLSIPDRFNENLPNLKDMLSKEHGKIFVCHRLDKQTSGVIVFAKNAKAHKFINEQFSNYENKKIYHTVVAGSFLRDELLIDIPLMPNPTGKGGVIPSARGKEAYTKVKVLERFKNSTLLECELLTGRQHQIRAQLKAIGYPILVDDMYGASDAFFLSSIKKKYNIQKHKEENPIMARVALHAFSMEMNHPNGEDVIQVEADYPKDFEILVKQLRKFSPMPQYYALSDEMNDYDFIPE
jgi:23S rRNA pseudouridine955/2504/2580 synthase/23S rRNA pseudouridine1911/1915/1917 synthase